MSNEVARVCLTHSFHDLSLDSYIGKPDTSDDETALIVNELSKITPDDYDRLIQLCDALAGNGEILDIEERMTDVKRRYGSYPESKWNANLRLKEYFEELTGRDIYSVTEKAGFRLC